MDKEIQSEIKKLNENINSYMQSNNRKIEEIRCAAMGKNMPLSEKMEDYSLKSDFDNYLRSGIEISAKNQ